MHAEITRINLLNAQLCVPKDWNDEQIIRFAESEICKLGYPCPHVEIAKEGDVCLGGDPARVQCAEHKDNVHVVVYY